MSLINVKPFFFYHLFLLVSPSLSPLSDAPGPHALSLSVSHPPSLSCYFSLSLGHPATGSVGQDLGISSIPLSTPPLLMIAHCFCHPHTPVHCTSLVGLRVPNTSTRGRLVLGKTRRHNQVDRQAWRERKRQPLREGSGQ